MFASSNLHCHKWPLSVLGQTSSVPVKLIVSLAKPMFVTSR